jgi:hypothetical protein
MRLIDDIGESFFDNQSGVAICALMSGLVGLRGEHLDQLIHNARRRWCRCPPRGQANRPRAAAPSLARNTGTAALSACRSATHR